MSIYLLWGEDDFRLEKALLNLRAKILGDDISPLNHRLIKSSDKTPNKDPDIRIVLENIQTTGMMFGNLLIEIHAESLFVRKKEDEEGSVFKKEFVDKIAETLEYLPPTVSVVFVCKTEKGKNKKIDGTSKIVKTIKKIGEIIEFQPFKSWETDKFVGWINENAKEKSLTMRPDAVQELLTCTGDDLRRLDSEISRLELLAYPEKIITKKLVNDLGLSCDNIFTFADVLISKNKQKARIELAKLLDKDEPLRVLGFLQSAVRQKLLMKIDAKTLSNFEISKKLNKHEYWVKKELEKLAKTSVEDLINLQKSITDTEFKIKTGKLEKKMALEMMVI